MIADAGPITMPKRDGIRSVRLGYGDSFLTIVNLDLTESVYSYTEAFEVYNEIVSWNSHHPGTIFAQRMIKHWLVLS